jgi:hypothetical protein
MSAQADQFLPLERQIIQEISKALETLGADPELLETLKSWGISVDDKDAYAALRLWNLDHEQTRT